MAHCLNPGWRPVQSARYFPFAAVKNVTVTGKAIRIDGAPFLKTGSPYLAENLAAQLRRLAGLPQGKRTAALKELLTASLDVEAIRQRLAEFNRQSSMLRLIANVLFFYLFAAAPYSIWRFGLANVWLRLVIGLLALTTTLAVLFYRGHRRLYTDAGDDRITHFCMILLSPATSIRAHDALARPLLETFHPIAVACVLLEPERFREFARRIVLEIRHPCLPVCPTDEPGPRAVEGEARTALQAAVEKFLEQQKIDIADLIRPPVPTDEACRSFCPRCNAQFTTTAGECADCGGLPLTAFPASPRLDRKTSD